MERHHGFRTRRLSKGLATVPEGPLFEGRFGRMFRRLPVFDNEDNDLLELADSMTQTGSDDNPNIPAGYTYLGQFIDHDITFDPNSSLQRMNDPEGLVNELESRASRRGGWSVQDARPGSLRRSSRGRGTQRASSWSIGMERCTR